MRILIVIPSLTKGGAERVVSILSKYWSDFHLVDLALYDTSKITYSYGGQIVDLRAPSRKSFLFKISNPFLRVVRLYLLTKRNKYDMVFSFMESANFPTIIATSLSSTSGKLSISVRNNPNGFIKIHQMLMRLLYGIPKRVIPISKGVESWLHEHKIALNNSETIPNPIDLEYIDTYLEKNQENKSSKRYKPFVIAVGRLVPQKGFDILIKAFKEIKNSHVKLLIFGEGEERTRLEALIVKLGLKEKVHLMGLKPELYEMYASATCFVLSSRYEGWGNVIMEAMSCNCPVISFDCDYGPRELIDNKNNGILVKKNDMDPLVKAIEDMISDKSLRQELSIRARKKIEDLDIKLISKKWLNEI